jgi:hypothetical protein
MSDDHSKTNILLSKIAKLKNSGGWKKWKTAIDEWIIDQDLDLPPPKEPDLILQGNAQNQQRIQEEYDVAYNKYLAGFTAWQRKQLKAANSIRSVCEDRAKAFIKDVDFVNDALIALEKEFKPKGDASLQEVYTKWSNCCLATCKGVDEYVDQFEDLYTELQSLEYELPRIELIFKFLDGLGPAFATWRQTFNMTHSVATDTDLSISTVQSLARVQEQQMNRESTIAMISARNIINKGPNRVLPNGRKHITSTADSSTSSMWCDHCASPGHSSDEGPNGCWILFPHLRETWRRNNPEKAAAADSRALARKEQRRIKRATGAKRLEATAPPPETSTTAAPTPISAKLAIRSNSRI